MQPLLFVSLIAFATSALAVGWLVRSRIARLALDEPNARSLHTSAMPRTGGIGLLLGTAAGWAYAAAQLYWPVWVALAVVIAVSLLDDLRGLPASVRLAAHLLAAMLAATAVSGTDSPMLLATAALAIAWMCNLYNFMDGSDGLAGGMALFGFSFYGIAAWLAGGIDFALLNFSVGAAAAAFLVFNFHPARIFMGDAGSVPLGFLASTFGLLGWLQHYWPWWFPVLIFSPFVVDASATLGRRLWRWEKVWEAHRDHYYQRLVQLGWGHRNTALAEYALMGLCGLCGLAGLAWPTGPQVGLMAAFAVAYLLIIYAIECAWRRFRSRR